MDEIIRVVIGYLIGVWRYRWMLVIVPAVVCPVGWFYVATLPDQYRASAQVFVDTDSVLKPLMSGLAVRIDDDRRIAMMTRLLFSREVMEKLGRMTDLDLKAKTPKEMDALIESLQARVKLSGSRANIYTLSFIDESPDLARKIVQSFLTIFVETNLGESRKDQDSAEKFVMQELKDYERRLVEAERKVKEFKARNLNYLSEGDGYYGKLQDAKSKLEQAKLDQQMAEERRDEMKEQLADYEEEAQDAPSPQAFNAPLSPIATRIQSLRGQIDELLLRYTERHPEVLALRNAIARLEEEQAAETPPEDEGNPVMDMGLSSNPVYQQMRLALSQAEADVASRQALVVEYSRRIEKLQSAVDRLLEVETEQKQLNRDYGILQGKHRGLLERLESLRLGRQVDTTAETVRFRVIEPPKVPDKPDGPNRVLFSSLVFGGALAAGLGLAFILSLFRPTFTDRKQLTEVTGVPVLGSVNMIWNEAQRRRRWLFNLAYGGSLATLLLAFGGVLAIHQFDIRLLSILSGL